MCCSLDEVASEDDEQCDCDKLEMISLFQYLGITIQIMGHTQTQDMKAKISMVLEPCRT